MLNYLSLFIINVFIELLVCFGRGFSGKNTFIAVVCVNAITHPLLTLAIQEYQVNFFGVLILEVFIVVVEYFLMKVVLPYTKQEIKGLAIWMNVSSFLIGGLVSLVLNFMK
jgi:hypothetical protein